MPRSLPETEKWFKFPPCRRALFRVDRWCRPGGHGGASGRYDRLHDTAFEYAFILTELGVTKVPQ